MFWNLFILYCRSLNSEFIQQIINLTKPFKLKSLFMSETLHIEQMELLLQKSGDYLENFGFGGDLRPFIDYDRSNQSFLLELIIKYCTKIKYFELTEFNNESIYKAFHLIENIKQSLNYLTISIIDIKLSSVVLHNLGQILPLRLDYLCLNII